MRDLPADLAAHLAGGATTLCHAWALTRRDGLRLGFTDHDRDLAFGDLTYAARTGLEAAEASAELGFAIGGGEVAGALTAVGIPNPGVQNPGVSGPGRLEASLLDAGLSDADIAGGLYDGATVETWLVDWSHPETRLLLDVGTIGEVRRAGTAFVAELRGLMDRLDAERGRTYRATCGADLGDARCRVDVADPRVSTTGSVLAVREPGTFEVRLAGPYASGWFAGGRLIWTSGAQGGQAADLREHEAPSGTVRLTLWQAPARAVSPGDGFRLIAGCDKRLATCREKFANVPNFQGFPHLSGNDFVLRQVPGSGPGLDGGSLFR